MAQIKICQVSPFLIKSWLNFGEILMKFSYSLDSDVIWWIRFLDFCPAAIVTVWFGLFWSPGKLEIVEKFSLKGHFGSYRVLKDANLELFREV